MFHTCQPILFTRFPTASIVIVSELAHATTSKCPQTDWGRTLPETRTSGEHQQVQVLRDLPRPRAITPINLGFGGSELNSPNTPTSAVMQSQLHNGNAKPPQTARVPVPVLKNDPRRPGYKSKALPLPPTSSVPLEREASQTSTGSSISKLERMDKSSSEWEVLSEAGSRLNEGETVNVDELQKKVDKRYVLHDVFIFAIMTDPLDRRSNFQYLESELAALDAQLKAAEERLARAKEQGIILPEDNGTDENRHT